MKRQYHVYPARHRWQFVRPRLLGVLPTLEDVESKPFVYGVGVNAGYDTNVNTTDIDATESAYMGGTLSADYRYVTDRTVFTIGASGGANYYFDQAPEQDDILYSGRIGGSLTHAITDRLSIDDKFYVSYDYDPNFMSGATLYRRNDEYFWGYNSLNVNYMWTDRLSSSTGFNIGTILYDASDISSTEDRVEYGANQLVRYALTEQTGLRAEYRYKYTDYDSGLDSSSHYILAGADHQFNENTMGLLMVGAEFYESGLSDSEVKPYAELGLTRVMTESLSLSWSNRLGYETSGVGIYDSNYTFRTNLDVTYQFSQKVSTFAGVSYLYTDYDGEPGATENLIEGRVGMNYALTEVLGLGLSYSFTNLDSDIEGQGYERQRINLGLNATF